MEDWQELGTDGEDMMKKEKADTSVLTKAFLTVEYWEKGKTLLGIQKMTGIHGSTIQRRMEVLGMERNSRSILKYTGILTEKFLMREFVGKGKSPWQIGREMGIDPKTVETYLKLAGIAKWLRGICNDFVPMKGKHNPNANRLTRDFLFMERVYGKSKRRIARENNVDRNTVQYRLDKFGIE